MYLRRYRKVVSLKNSLKMSDEEADLYYDAISTGITPDQTNSSSTHTESNHHSTIDRPENLKECDRNSLEKLTPRGSEPASNAHIDQLTKQTELHASRRAPGGNKVLDNIAKFEAVTHDNHVNRSSPVRDKSKSPVHGGNFSDKGEKILGDKTKTAESARNIHEDEDGWNKWEARNESETSDNTQGNNTDIHRNVYIAESKGIAEPEEDGWKEWEMVNQYKTSDSEVVREHGKENARQDVYSFAQPFPVDIVAEGHSQNNNSSHFQRQTDTQGWVISQRQPLEDSLGYSHARNFPGILSKTKPDDDPPQVPPDRPEVVPGSYKGLAVADIDTPVPTAHEEFEQTIYDSVCSDSSGAKTLDQSGASELDAKLNALAGVDKDGKPIKPQGKQFGNHSWSRKAKLRSRALKRSHKSKESPFTGHHEFQDPAEGAVPEAENEDFMEALSPFNMSDHSSGSSFLSDSSFDSPISDFSDDEIEASTISYNNKPLPPVPNKKKVDLQEEDGLVLEQVKLRTPRDAPSLPDAPDALGPTQKKLRGVLQSLIDNERNYIGSLQRLVDEYKGPILTQFITKSREVKVTFTSVEEILTVHKMFEIELAEKLKNWYTEEKIGGIFHVFSQQMVIEFYSTYVNNFESTCETIKETENSRQAFKDFLKNKQMSSFDRLSLAGLMLKPVQRFPQLIMIIKDLLKYTPRDHHDREPLQEALTGLENVAHQLNERKRHTEQYYLGQQIISRLTPRIHLEKHSYLIRQDDMEQMAQGSPGKITLRLILMSKAVICLRYKRDQDGHERFTYKWHQSLKDLELTTSAITPTMHTRVQSEAKNTTVFSPKPDGYYDEDPYSVASDLTDMMHDVTILGQISQLVSTLKHTYPGITEDQLQENITKLQRDIQGKDYQLQMLNSSSIILQDKLRKKKYVFSAATANIKQEWCTDFLMAKYALDIVNMPSWFVQDKKESGFSHQPALLTRHLSVDMQRTFTRVKCGVRVFFPTKNEGSVEHLWVCSSTMTIGQVSIVALHTSKPNLVESFQATKCDIICVEMVPGFALVENELAFPEDSVWMSTVDSEILVFQFSEQKDDTHRQPVHRFLPGCIVICMTYIDDKVFCGGRGGLVLVYSRNDDGIWYGPERIQLGTGSVTSILGIGNCLWAACGSGIYIIDPETCKIQERVSHQMDDKDCAVQYLVKAGVGVWASFHGKPNIVLYHSESKRMLQDFNITTSIKEFIIAHTGEKVSTTNYEVTSLLVSLGLLWVGTSLGIILTYPLPRLRDGVPRINQRPQVALHGHNGPIRFLVPVHYGPVSGTPIRRRPSSILKRNNVDKVVVKKLPKLKETHSSEHDNIYVSLDEEAMQQSAFENLYEPVGFHGDAGSNTNLKNVSDDCANNSKVARQFSEKKYYTLCPQTKQYVPVESPLSEAEIKETPDHTYFILQPQTKQFVPVRDFQYGAKNLTTPQSSINPQDRTVENDTGNNNDSEYMYMEINDFGNKSFKDKQSDIPNETDLPLKTDDVTLRQKNDELSGKPKTFCVDYTTESQSAQRHTEPVIPDRLVSENSSENQSSITNKKPVKIPGMMNQQTLPFKAELKNKIKNRQSQENLIDLAVTQDGMGRLYETLMRSPRDTRRDSDFCSSLPSNYEQSYIRPRTTVAISSKKPDITATRFNSSRKQDKTPENKSVQSQNKSNYSTPVSFSSPASKPSMGSSFSSGVDTLKKQNSNTILVLSGGDGYKDWKKRYSQQSYRPEEPCLIFWMYKF